MTSSEASRRMGLVVALRFLSWGIGCFALTGGTLLGIGLERGARMSFLALGGLLGGYLYLTGSVLMVGRLEGWSRKLCAASPILALCLSSIPSVQGSLVALAWIWGGAVGLTWSAYLSQAASMSHSKTSSYGRVVVGCLPVGLVAFHFMPLPPFAFAGCVLTILASWIYWQLWLRELRRDISGVSH